MKRFIFISLLALSVMTSYAYDVCINGIYYNLVPEAKQASVSSGDIEYTGKVIIPEKITSGNVEYSVTSIGKRAFEECYSLTSIVIPNSVTSIGDYAFISCSSLASIDIPNSVMAIGEHAFAICTSLTSIVIPNSVTSIGDYAFSTCTSLTSIDIPNSVTSIGEEAFIECNSLTSIVIPNSVTEIHDLAFSHCYSLTSIVIPNSVTSIGSHAFSTCTSLTSIDIPNSVTAIGLGAFAGCTSLTSIAIPNSVASILSSAFNDCSSLTSIVIPNSVTQIRDNTFKNCSSLTSIVIPNSVTSIGEEAFKNCEKLTNITIGCSVSRISTSAFGNCANLENVYCNAVNVPNLASDAFESSYIESVNLYVPEESLDDYRSNAIWNRFGSIMALTPINLIDGEDYTNRIEKPCHTLTYTRNFTNTNWNAFYVPFAMQYEDWSEDFEVASLNDVHQFDDDEDGEIDRTVLEVVKLKEGSSTEPNTPYMIKAKEAGEKTITLTDATLYAAEENSFDVTSWYTKFTFTGTYNTVTDMATQGHYAMANGGLKQASSDAATLGAFRWYLDITDRSGNPAPLKSKKVLLSFDDGETTAINVVEANVVNNTNAVYSISGVKVGNNKTSIPKGLYISNGKKIIIK